MQKWGLFFGALPFSHELTVAAPEGAWSSMVSQPRHAGRNR